jgi:hypothetical protein
MSKSKMKRIMMSGMVLACALAILGCASVQYASNARGRSKDADSISQMTKNDIIALSHAGVSDSVIMTMLDVTGSSFRLNTHDVIALADSGVSHNVINAMVRTPETLPDVDRVQVPHYYPPYYWYAYDPFWEPWYYPYWDGWYYPGSTIRLGYVYHGGFGGRGFGGRRHR